MLQVEKRRFRRCKYGSLTIATSLLAFHITGRAEIHEAASAGPDLAVSSLLAPRYSHYSNQGGVIMTPVWVGVRLCNVGNEPIRYEFLPSQHHPLVRTSIYRLRSKRLEQLAISKVYHANYLNEPLNDSQCGLECIIPSNPKEGEFYPGCSTNYPADQLDMVNLSSSAQVNAFTATFTPPAQYPDFVPYFVRNSDVVASVAMYFEAQALSIDDAMAGNQENNVTHQGVRFVSAPAQHNDFCPGTDPNRLCPVLTNYLQPQRPAIRAWNATNPSVVETDIQVPGEGVFVLAATVTETQSGLWHYEYALYNQNSDRSGRSFSLLFPIGADVENIGFHDVDYPADEPFDPTDWPASVTVNLVQWSTQDYYDNLNANALRWGTLYNFWFDANVPPSPTTVEVGLFKPGIPTSIHADTVGPSLVPSADGDFDLADFTFLVRCFSTTGKISNFLPTAAQCLANYDVNLDGEINLVDWKEWHSDFLGPRK